LDTKWIRSTIRTLSQNGNPGITGKLLKIQRNCWALSLMIQGTVRVTIAEPSMESQRDSVMIRIAMQTDGKEPG